MGQQSSNNQALKSGIWYTVGNFATKAMAFITVPIFTRLLSTEEVGYFSNLTSWVAILVVIVTMNLYSSVGVARFDFKDSLDDYIASNLLLGSIITMIFYIVVLFFKSQVSRWLGLREYEIHLIFTYFLFYPAIEMFQTKNRILYKYKLSTFLSVGSVVVSTLLSLLGVLLLQNRYIGRLFGYYTPLIIVNLCIYIYILKKSKKISVKYWKYAISISLPLVWHTLSTNILNSSDRVMINNMCGATANAFYSVAYSCAMIVQILWTSMNSAWSPWAFEKMDEQDYKTLKKASIPYIIFFGIIVLGFMLLAPEVIWIMGGESYLSAVYVIPPVMVAYVFQFVYSLYVNIEIYSKKSIYIATGTTCAAIINIVLNLIFIPSFGYIAAAYTTLAGYVALFLIHFAFVKKIKKERWYNTKFNFLFLFVFLIIMLLCNVLYSFSYLRFLVIGGIMLSVLLLGIRYRKILFVSLKEKSISPIIDCVNAKKRK